MNYRRQLVTAVAVVMVLPAPPSMFSPLRPLAVPNYGTVKFLTTSPDNSNPCYGAYLDQPSGAVTTPVVGDNAFFDHTILFSLPIKIGGRFASEVAISKAGKTTFQCGSLTQAQFFNLNSVQRAELILKSLSYAKS